MSFINKWNVEIDAGCRLLVCWLLVAGYWLLVCWLLVAGCWLLVAGCRTLVSFFFFLLTLPPFREANAVQLLAAGLAVDFFSFTGEKRPERFRGSLKAKPSLNSLRRMWKTGSNCLPFG